MFDMLRNKIEARLPVFVGLICAVIALLSTFVPSAVGPANNSDFMRVMYPNRISFVDNNPRTTWNGYGFTPTFEMSLGGSDWSLLTRAVYFLHTDFSRFDYPTTQILTIKLSKFLNLGHNIVVGAPLYTYNLFWLALIHIAIFAAALILILGFIYRRFGKWAFAFATFTAVFVLSDQGYSLYFNSFYGEGLQYVLTLLAIGLLLRLEERRSGGALLAYYIAVYFMATTKLAWVPVGLFFALVPLGFLLVKKLAVLRMKIVAGCSLTLLALLVFHFLLTPSWIDDASNFNSVFRGVLTNSQTPEQDLIWLGLDPEFAILEGVNWFQYEFPIDVVSDEFQENFFEKVSKTRILMFYLNHPMRLLDILQVSAEHARHIRSPLLTSVQVPQYMGQQVHRFSLWEFTRVWLAPLANFWFIAAALGAAVAWAGFELIKIVKKGQNYTNILLPFLMLAIVVSAAASFVIPYVANGTADLAKQLFGFISLFDIVIFTLIGKVLLMAYERKANMKVHLWLKNKFNK